MAATRIKRNNVENPEIGSVYEQHIVTDAGILSYKIEEITNDKYRKVPKIERDIRHMYKFISSLTKSTDKWENMEGETELVSNNAV